MRVHTIDTGRWCAAAAGLLLLVVAVEAQVMPAPPATTAAPAPAARAADVASIDAIVAAVYDVISGPAGAARDWDRFRSLFAPKARLMPTGRRPDGSGVLREWSPEEYIATAGAGLQANGFFERELARTVERYGDVLHVFSTYDSRRTASDARPFARGINSIQVHHDGARFWIVSVFWQGERPDLPIPARYLPAGG